MQKDLRIYVPYGSVSYANWMGGKIVDDYEDSNLVLITGGEDISPSIYGETPHSTVWANRDRDIIELEAVERAIQDNKLIWGTCRGIQLLCAVAGGKLVQHMNHPGGHFITTPEGEMFTNSLHHQLQYPFNMVEGEDYIIYGYAKGISKIHESSGDLPIELPKDKDGYTIEPEIVYYPKINALGHQAHPEMMYGSTRYADMMNYTQMLFNKFITNTLIEKNQICYSN